MGYKSRGNWSIRICLKRCANKNKKCKDCFRFSHFAPLSLCCNAPVKAGGTGITHYYICTKCGEACDI